MRELIQLGSKLDDIFRDDLGENFDRIKQDLENLNQRLLEVILNEGDSLAEVKEARIGSDGKIYKTLDERLRAKEYKADDAISQSNNALTQAANANAKANNPLAALSLAGYKLTLNDLSQEVIDNMTGAAALTLGQGYIDSNRGAIFPLRQLTKDGAIQPVSDAVKNTLIDVKVFGAKQDKYYAVDWIGNGYDDGTNGPTYGFILSEYDKATYATAAVRRQILYYAEMNFPAPTTNIVTRVIDLAAENLVFVITYDKSVIEAQIVKTHMQISNPGYGNALSSVIDEANYIYSKTGTEKGYLSVNSAKEYPLKNVQRDGAIRNRITDVEAAILDIKVINALPGKWYKVEWLGNGTTAWGAPVYSVYLEEFDYGTFNNRRGIFNRTNAPLPAPTENIVTRLISITGESVMLSITIDYSKLKADKYIMNDVNYAGYGYVIDPSCYIQKSQVTPESLTAINMPLACQRVGRNCRVKFSYDDARNMVLDFDALGINEITHLKRIYIENKKTLLGLDNIFDNTGLYHTLSTDWISPYGIQARTNITNPNNSFTVGGNHGTDGGGGFATARHIQTKMYADNKEVLDGQTLYAKEKVVVVAEHEIAAANVIDSATGAKRYCVKEYVTYVITPNTFNVSVILEALEPVTYTRYFGPQSVKGPWGEKLYFMQDTIAEIHQISTDWAGENSGPWPASKADRFVLKGADGNILVGQVNRSVGIGDGRYIAPDQPPIHLTVGEFGKVYAHLIRNNNVDIDTGGILYWEGAYHLSPGLTCPGAEAAYFFTNAGKRIYCADFFQAANTYLKVLKEDSNKKVVILEKSDTLTVDSFITPLGLQIVSTGYGSVKFTLE